MAEQGDNQQPIVIRKKKKRVEGEGHGGAWKVAYADFVTAMMAFFLLMWLLNATTKEQQSGIADYFSPVSASESTSGGGGVLSGQTVAKDGALTSRNAPVGMNMKVPKAPPTEESGEGDGKGDGSGKTDEKLKQAASKIKQGLQQSSELKQLKKHISLEQTDRGLKIRIMDRIEQTMFERGSAKPRPKTKKLLQEIAANIKDIPNAIIIQGHTDATSFGGGAAGYSNWELSSERANATRRILVKAGVKPPRINKVVGMADQNLLLPNKPTSPKNRRISILLVRSQQKTVASDGGPSVPSGSTAPAAGDRGGTNGAGGGNQQSRPSGGQQNEGGPSLLDEEEEG